MTGDWVVLHQAETLILFSLLASHLIAPFNTETKTKPKNQPNKPPPLFLIYYNPSHHNGILYLY